MTLKDSFFDPKGNKEIKNDEIVIKENGEKEVPTLHTKYDLFNIGSNIHNSAIVGSSVLTMQIEQTDSKLEQEQNKGLKKLVDEKFSGRIEM